MKKIFFILFTTIILFACKKEDYSYTGDPFVDFPKSSQYITIKGNVYSNYTVPVSVRLAAAHSSNPYNVTFEVLNTSSAINGTHYSIESNSIQIPANSSFGEIPITFLIPSFPEQSWATVVIKLTGGDLKVNPNTDQITLYVYRQGFIDLFVGNYSCEEADKPISVKYNVTSAADTSVKNRLLISNFWNFAKDDSKVYLDFKSTVDSVYLPSQSFTDQLNRQYTVSGSGKYSINDGSYYINYILAEEGTSFTEQNTQTYRRR